MQAARHVSGVLPERVAERVGGCPPCPPCGSAERHHPLFTGHVVNGEIEEAPAEPKHSAFGKDRTGESAPVSAAGVSGRGDGGRVLPWLRSTRLERHQLEAG